MMNINNETKNKIIRITHAIIPNATIYLFGSRALGQHHQRSDIDLAIDAGIKLERLTIGELRDILNASNIPYHFDVVDIHNVDRNLKEHIITEGIIWTINSNSEKK